MPFIHEIRNIFDRAAAFYEKDAILPHEIGQRLFERLDYLKIEPNYILDLGCGPGVFSKQLKNRYPKAVIVSVDLSERMLNKTKHQQRWLKRWPRVCADMHHLPFVDGLFDLVFANQVLQWSNPLPSVVDELSRVMNREGCLMFSMLGPDTFQELTVSTVDPVKINAQLLDMHNIGDCLVNARFLDPVMDMEMLTIHHQHLSALLTSMRVEGIRNKQTRLNTGLVGKKRWDQFAQKMQQTCTTAGKFPLTYEVIYGHAWKGDQRKTAAGIETYIPITALRRS